MRRKQYGVEFQTAANIKLLSARTKTRNESIQRAKGWIATYQEALRHAENSLERLIEAQETDSYLLDEAQHTMQQIVIEKEKIIRDIIEYRRTRPEDYDISQSDQGERNAN